MRHEFLNVLIPLPRPAHTSSCTHVGYGTVAVSPAFVTLWGVADVVELYYVGHHSRVCGMFNNDIVSYVSVL